MSPATNPLLAPWTTPYGLPPFDLIRAEDFGPAFDEALAQHQAELRALAEQADPPGFANTIAALDRSGGLLSRVALTFFNLSSSQTSEALQEVERLWLPRLSVHNASVLLDPALFRRVQAVYEARAGLGLDPVQLRLVEKTHLDFVLAGARLAAAARDRVTQLAGELAEACTAFAQAVLADEDETSLAVTDEAELDGVPADLKAAAAEVAKSRGTVGWVLPVGRSFVEPLLALARSRGLRERVWRAFTARGELKAARDTKPLIARILALRGELARLQGYPTYADYALVNRMAQTPARVAALLEQVWPAALRRAADEEAELGRLAASDGLDRLQAWDWLYYADQVKRRDYALDEAELKPYFSVDRMVEAMFWVAGELFGVDFVPVTGVPLYHPDVRLFEVRNRGDGSLQGLFLSDNFARPGKRSGAWMSNYREQAEGVVPIVVNNNNFVAGPPGEPVLISFDDVSTLFHEFGHGLHGLLSQVPYRSLSGTNVLGDFVELPSQLYEHWALAPEVLRRFARHHLTGETIPPALVDRIRRTRTFNSGWETVQQLGPTLLDMKVHSLTSLEGFEASAFEAGEARRLGVPPAVGLRHRLVHFQHLFSGDGYAAGYYMYLWAEVLEADVFAAFEEKGDLFDPALAASLKANIYAAGNAVPPEQAFRAFRGREPEIGPLLRQRGLA